VLGRVGKERLDSGEMREEVRGLLRGYKKYQRCIYSERIQCAWTFPLSVKKCIEHPKPLRVSAALPAKKTAQAIATNTPNTPNASGKLSLQLFSCGSPCKKKQPWLVLAITFIMLRSLA